MKHARKAAFLLMGLLLLSSCVPTATPQPIPVPPEVELLPLEPFALGEKYARYYPETTLEFIPRDDYGPVYPYIGGVTLMGPWRNNLRYGFCDAEGRIVCDPSFNEVQLHEHEGRRAYVCRKTTRLDETRIVCLLAGDGRFLLTFEAVYDGGEGTFTVKRDGKWGSVDYEGRELLPCVYAYPMTFSDGLAVVSDSFGDGYWFVDRENRAVLGPFLPPPLAELDEGEIVEEGWLQTAFLQKNIIEGFGFLEGRAKYFQDGMYGYMDTMGEAVTPAVFSGSWDSGFQDGRAVVHAADSNWCVLIDLSGNEIVSVNGGSITANGDGIWTVYDAKNRLAWFVDRDGNLLHGPYEYDEANYRLTHCGYLGNGWFFLYMGDEDAYALLRDGVVYDVGGPFGLSVVGEDHFYARYDTGSDTQKIIDHTGKVYLESGDGIDISVYNAPDGCCEVRLHETNLYGIIRFDGSYVIPPTFDLLFPLGDHYLVRQGMYGGLLNLAGEWVIKVSLLDSMED